MRHKDRPVIITQLILALLIIAAWEALAGGFGTGWHVLDPLLFSSPSQIAADLYQIFSRGLLWIDIGVTLEEAFFGLVLGMVTGFILGLLSAYSSFLARVLDPFMAAVNATPRLALAPIFMLWLGIGISSKVALAWLVVFFIVYYNTYQGARSVDPDLIRAIRVTGASQRQIIRIVILPSVFAWAFAALRPSVGFALIAAVGGEFVGANHGLGYQLLVAQGLLVTARIYSILVILMVVGVIVTAACQQIENRVLRWRPAASL
jgi:NitT/TauT family transport system permease protein